MDNIKVVPQEKSLKKPAWQIAVMILLLCAMIILALMPIIRFMTVERISFYGYVLEGTRGIFSELTNEEFWAGDGFSVRFSAMRNADGFKMKARALAATCLYFVYVLSMVAFLVLSQFFIVKGIISFIKGNYKAVIRITALMLCMFIAFIGLIRITYNGDIVITSFKENKEEKAGSQITHNSNTNTSTDTSSNTNTNTNDHATTDTSTSTHSYTSDYTDTNTAASSGARSGSVASDVIGTDTNNDTTSTNTDTSSTNTDTTNTYTGTWITSTDVINRNPMFQRQEYTNEDETITWDSSMISGEVYILEVFDARLDGYVSYNSVTSFAESFKYSGALALNPQTSFYYYGGGSIYDTAYISSNVLYGLYIALALIVAAATVYTVANRKMIPFGYNKIRIIEKAIAFVTLTALLVQIGKGAFGSGIRLAFDYAETFVKLKKMFVSSSMSGVDIAIIVFLALGFRSLTVSLFNMDGKDKELYRGKPRMLIITILVSASLILSLLNSVVFVKELGYWEFTLQKPILFTAFIIATCIAYYLVKAVVIKELEENNVSESSPASESAQDTVIPVHNVEPIGVMTNEVITSENGFEVI